MNGILVIDKDQGWTSQDVVSKLRNYFKIKKIGHTGTLDPMATGVLPICIGKATRLSELYLNDDKVYIAEITFGTSTTTQDAWGDVVDVSSVRPSKKAFEEALEHFKGRYLQTPPMYSAIKINGKKLYELAREGKTVKRKAREVYLYDLNCLGFSENTAKFSCRCSKGTYIRTLCHDLSTYLGTYGHLSNLRRVQSGKFSIDESRTIEDVLQTSLTDISKELLPMDWGLDSLPFIRLNPTEVEKVCFGQKIPYSFDKKVEDRWIRIYGEEKFIGLGQFDGEKLHVKKLLL